MSGLACHMWPYHFGQVTSCPSHMTVTWSSQQDVWDLSGWAKVKQLEKVGYRAAKVCVCARVCSPCVMWTVVSWLELKNTKHSYLMLHQWAAAGSNVMLDERLVTNPGNARCCCSCTWHVTTCPQHVLKYLLIDCEFKWAKRAPYPALLEKRKNFQES